MCRLLHQYKRRSMKACEKLQLGTSSFLAALSLCCTGRDHPPGTSLQCATRGQTHKHTHAPPQLLLRMTVKPILKHESLQQTILAQCCSTHQNSLTVYPLEKFPAIFPTTQLRKFPLDLPHPHTEFSPATKRFPIFFPVSSNIPISYSAVDQQIPQMSRNG